MKKHNKIILIGILAVILVWIAIVEMDNLLDGGLHDTSIRSDGSDISTITESNSDNNSTLDPPVEPDTGEFRYGVEECRYIDANGEQNSCVVEGWTKPASELDCEEICKPPGIKK